MYKTRRNRLESYFKENKVEAILFSNLLNIRYLSGFSGSEGALLITPDKCWLLCDSRYTTQARLEVVDTEVIQFSEKKIRLLSSWKNRNFPLSVLRPHIQLLLLLKNSPLALKIVN